MKLRIKNITRLARFIFVLLISLSVFYFSHPTKSYSQNLSKKVVVTRGDTIWSIANHYYPDENLPKKTYEIAELNNIEDGTIYPGQVIILP